MVSQQRILEHCVPHLAQWVPPEFGRYVEPHIRSGLFFTYLRKNHKMDGHPFLLLTDREITIRSAQLATPGSPFQVVGLSEAHDLIFFGRPDPGLPMNEVAQLTLALSAKGCYVMIAPVSPRQFEFYFAEYLARPLVGPWLMVTNWDPDLFS